MKPAILKPSLLALAFALPVASSQAEDCTAKQAAKPEAAANGDIVYFSPLVDLMRIQAAMEREFNALNTSLWMPVLFAQPTAFALPAVRSSSLRHTPEGYQLELKLPGFKAEDIHVSLDGQLLTVSAQTSSHDAVKVGQQSEQSLSSRSYAETLTLPGPVQASGLKESYKDGVLTITVPSSKGAGGSV